MSLTTLSMKHRHNNLLLLGVTHDQPGSRKAGIQLCVCVQRDIDGRTYYEFEFATKANTYIRHALAVVTVANGTALLVARLQLVAMSARPIRALLLLCLCCCSSVWCVGKHLLVNPCRAEVVALSCRQVLHADNRFK